MISNRSYRHKSGKAEFIIYKKYVKGFLNSFVNVLITLLFVIPILDILYTSYKSVLTVITNPFLASIITAIIGGISIGNPVSGYIIAGELYGKISIAAIISFLVAWVTVGIMQIPIESKYFGLKFSVLRNIVGLIFSVLAGLIAILILP